MPWHTWNAGRREWLYRVQLRLAQSTKARAGRAIERIHDINAIRDDRLNQFPKGTPTRIFLDGTDQAFNTGIPGTLYPFYDNRLEGLLWGVIWVAHVMLT